MNKKEGVQMGISSRFTVGVHMLTLLAIDRNSRCTSEWIAGSEYKSSCDSSHYRNVEESRTC